MADEHHCVCQSVNKIQRHHILRRRYRQGLLGDGISIIKVFWEKNGKEISTCIPVTSYVKFCEECHKLNHPENISYHLNEVVVHTLIKAKRGETNGSDVGNNCERTPDQEREVDKASWSGNKNP